MTKRNDRLNALLLQETASALRGEAGLNSGGVFTLTGAELFNEGKDLRVFYSVLGTPEHRRRCEAILLRSARGVRDSFRRRLRLRIIPNVIFVFDDTPEKAAKMEELFTKIKKEAPVEEAAGDDED